MPKLIFILNYAQVVLFCIVSLLISFKQHAQSAISLLCFARPCSLSLLGKRASGARAALQKKKKKKSIYKKKNNCLEAPEVCIKLYKDTLR